MKIAVIENDKIIIKQAEDEKLGDRKGAIVKVLGCGLCGSDIVKFVHKIAKNGTVLGHEIVAKIVDINSDTDFKIGDEIVECRRWGSNGWLIVIKLTFGPIKTPSSNVIPPRSIKVQQWLIKTFLPTLIFFPKSV